MRRYMGAFNPKLPEGSDAAARKAGEAACEDGMNSTKSNYYDGVADQFRDTFNSISSKDLLQDDVDLDFNSLMTYVPERFDFIPRLDENWNQATTIDYYVADDIRHDPGDMPLTCMADGIVYVPAIEANPGCGIDHYEECRVAAHGIETYAVEPNKACGISTAINLPLDAAKFTPAKHFDIQC